VAVCWSTCTPGHQVPVLVHSISSYSRGVCISPCPASSGVACRGACCGGLETWSHGLQIQVQLFDALVAPVLGSALNYGAAPSTGVSNPIRLHVIDLLRVQSLFMWQLRKASGVPPPLPSNCVSLDVGRWCGVGFNACSVAAVEQGNGHASYIDVYPEEFFDYLLTPMCSFTTKPHEPCLAPFRNSFGCFLPYVSKLRVRVPRRLCASSIMLVGGQQGWLMSQVSRCLGHWQCTCHGGHPCKCRPAPAARCNGVCWPCFAANIQCHHW